ncbi:MAG: hypothetical protein RL762_1109 [Bacteroidota bacterium]|jgi:hypothetical protein
MRIIKVIGVLFLQILLSCNRETLVVIYENSSEFDMILEVSLNSEILDTITIPNIKEQFHQISFRKKYQGYDEYNFNFRELISGKELKKSFNIVEKNISFIIIGVGEIGREFSMDTVTYDYVPEYE